MTIDRRRVKSVYKIILISILLILVDFVAGCRSRDKISESSNKNTETEHSIEDSLNMLSRDKQLIIPEADFHIKVYVPSLDKKIELINLKDNVQNNISEYSGTYNWLMNPAGEYENGSWTELRIYFKNSELKASSTFYAEAEPDPEIHLKDASIYSNYFYAKDAERIINGKFIYFESKVKNKIVKIYGLLVKENADYEFYEKVN